MASDAQDLFSDAGESETVAPSWWTWWSAHLGSLVFVGLVGGVAAGIFFGDYCSVLSVVGDAFVDLLRLTVLPFIATTLVVNLGRQSLKTTGRLALVGGTVLAIIWLITLVMVYLLAKTLPSTNAGSFYSSAMVDPETGRDLLAVIIPNNIFSALSNNHVPAIILFCILIGVSLATVTRRETLITQLEIVSNVLLRASTFIAKLAPIGVFAITASTAGTISLEEFSRLQGYLVLYCVGVLLMGFLVFPALLTAMTPLSYRQVLKVIREPLMTAFATGKVIIVLPMLIENTERLLATDSEMTEKDRIELEVLFAAGYAFPNAGKLLSMLFIPFASWFLGNELRTIEYPGFLSAGLVSYAGGPGHRDPLLARPHAFAA